MGLTGFVTGSPLFASKKFASSTSSKKCSRVVPQMAEQAVANRQRREAIVQTVKGLFDESMLAFSVPLPGYSVKEVFELRKQMPEGTKVMAIKNTLLERAVADTTWKVCGDLCSGSNIWFFVKEDMKATVETLNKYNKDLKKEETNMILGGVLEGTLYDQKGVEQLSKLPSKLELIQKIAIAIKMVPTKLGRSVKEVPTKVGRAIKLAYASEDE